MLKTHGSRIFWVAERIQREKWTRLVKIACQTATIYPLYGPFVFFQPHETIGFICSFISFVEADRRPIIKFRLLEYFGPRSSPNQAKFNAQTSTYGSNLIL